MDQYAVMGNPIEHSKSPLIHSLFAEETRQRMEYNSILVELGQLDKRVKAFRANGGRGLNITVPFKENAFRLVDRLTPRAQKAGAVNTLMFQADQIIGDNTDGAGLIRDITRNHYGNLRGKDVLVLGAGGAVRGILQPLLQERPGRVIIANRTEAKAVELAKQFSALGVIEACGLDSIPARPMGWIINGSSASLQGVTLSLPEAIINQDTQCYDMMYSSETTPFNAWALALGASSAIDGLGMLVEQAAESFFMWRGIRPTTAVVIQRLRSGKA